MKLLLTKMIVCFLAFLKQVRFPVRRTGCDNWVWKWRLDFLLNKLEKESLVWCRKIIHPNMIVVDVGAHIGYYTKIFSRSVGKNGCVLAFEPCSENYPVLVHNLTKKKFQNVKIFRKAVGSENIQNGCLFVSPGHSNHSLNAGYTANPSQESVEIIALDSFLKLQNIKSVNFIKIDVEGAELSVLNGLKKIIAQSPNLHMLIELNPLALKVGGNNAPELISFVKSLNFQPYRILKNGDLDADVFIDSEETINIACIPEKSKYV